MTYYVIKFRGGLKSQNGYITSKHLGNFDVEAFIKFEENEVFTNSLLYFLSLLVQAPRQF